MLKTFHGMGTMATRCSLRWKAPQILQKECTFIVDRSTYGKDEVDALLYTSSRLGSSTRPSGSRSTGTRRTNLVTSTPCPPILSSPHPRHRISLRRGRPRSRRCRPSRRLLSSPHPRHRISLRRGRPRSRRCRPSRRPSKSFGQAAGIRRRHERAAIPLRRRSRRRSAGRLWRSCGGGFWSRSRRASDRALPDFDSPFYAGCMLVRPDDRGIDGMLLVSWRPKTCQGFECRVPHADLAPACEAHKD